jgi:hypothetical protein
LTLVLAPGVDDKPPTVLLDVSLDVKGSVELVLLLRLPILTVLSAARNIRSLPSAASYIRWVGRGLIRWVGRGLRTGGCRSHALKIDL